jgi:plasmid stabilization system protein ParE
MRVEFHAEAIEELQGAARYYEERQIGLGVRFLDAVEEAIERIASDPRAWTSVDEGIHRCLTRVFPFGILYSLEGEFVLILVVAHLAREPGYWRSRR